MSDSVALAQSLLLQALEQISALDSKIGVLQGQANIIISEQGRAAEGRAETHERLRQLEQTAAESASTIERIAPLVEAHEKTYQQGQGAIWLWRILWGVITGGSGAALALLIAKLLQH